MQQVVQELMKVAADLQCVYISIPVFVSIKENINNLLSGLLKVKLLLGGIFSFNLKELNIIRIGTDQNTVAHVSHIK